MLLQQVLAPLWPWLVAIVFLSFVYEKRLWLWRMAAREALRRSSMDGRDHQRQRFEMATRDRPDPETARREEQERHDALFAETYGNTDDPANAPDINDASMRQSDWEHYLTTP